MSEKEKKVCTDDNDGFQIKEEYEKLLPPASPEEDEALENSILQNGQCEPIVLNQEKIVLDGHRRLRVCRKNGVKPKYVIRKFENKIEEKKFIIETNLIRRQLTTFQRIELALPLMEIQRELAKERKLSTLKKGDELPDGTNLTDRGKALEIVAKTIGVSYGTLQQALYVMEHASKEEFEKLRKGEKSIYRAYMELKNNSEKKEAESGIPRFLVRLLNRAPKKCSFP